MLFLYLNTYGSITDEGEILVDFEDDPGRFSHLEVMGPQWVPLADPLRMLPSLSPAVRGAWGPVPDTRSLDQARPQEYQGCCSAHHTGTPSWAPRRIIPRVSLPGKPVLSS